MRSTLLRHAALFGIVALGVSALLTGCSPGESADGGPRTAAEAGRDVFRPTGSRKPAAPAGSIESGEPTETVSGDRVPADPVIAPKPDLVSETAPEVALASAEERIADAATPRVTEPGLDPSRFPGGVIPASPNAQPLPGGPRLLVPHRTFRAEGRPRALRVTYDDLDLLKVLNMGDPLPRDAVDHFPDWLRELDGQTIRLRGFMYPSYQQELSAFILTRDTGVCCFGPNPKVYYLVSVKLKDGQKVGYIGDRPFDVVGTFRIQPIVDDEGNWMALYRITDAMVVE